MTGAAAAFVGGSGVVAVTLSPTAVAGFYDAGGTSNVTTGSVIATPAGGFTPYSYAWAAIDVSPYTWTISAATSATTSFTCQSLPEGTIATRIFEVTVTDSAGIVGRKRITATARNNNILFDGGSFRDGFGVGGFL